MANTMMLCYKKNPILAKQGMHLPRRRGCRCLSKWIFLEFFEQTDQQIMGTPSPPFMTSVSGNLLELKKDFHDQVEEGGRALEYFLSRSMSVHMTHQFEADRVFLTLLTEPVQHMLKLHRMMEAQFWRFHSVLGTGCHDGNWILDSQFAEAVLAGTWRARLIGVDAFKKTGHTRCAMYFWAALQMHRVLQGSIELGFIMHPEVSSVVVEHLLQMRIGLKASVKASVATVEKLESRMARQTTDFAKLQQDVKVAFKNKWSKQPLEELRDDAPKLLKTFHVSLEALVVTPVLPDADKKWKVCGYF
jgi:hypothetical protein